jgi:CheY-like chemotaxis protein
LGLSITRQLVELHGGTIEAQSGGKGRGSEFIVRLPIMNAELAKRPAAESATESAYSAAGRRILIIDDNADAAALLESVLRAAGHEVRNALDGRAGLTLAQEFAPDIVFLDLAMPGMDGYEVMHHLREPQRARPKIIALTGFGAETERDRIRQAGFDAHLVKPVESRKILDLISSLEW